MQRPTIIRTTAAAFVAAALTLAACGGDDDEANSPAATSSAAASSEAAGSAAAGDNVITIASFAFGGVTSVAAGTTVTVTNNDTVPHTVTADDGSFDTGTIQPGDSAEFTVAAAGTFAFHCNFHSSMAGSITVTS